MSFLFPKAVKYDTWFVCLFFFSILQETQELALSVLIDIMRGVPLKALLPYSDPRCRAGLYAVLQRLILCPNPQFPAPLNYASAIFNIGLNDPCIEVHLSRQHENCI